MSPSPPSRTIRNTLHPAVTKPGPSPQRPVPSCVFFLSTVCAFHAERSYLPVSLNRSRGNLVVVLGVLDTQRSGCAYLVRPCHGLFPGAYTPHRCLIFSGPDTPSPAPLVCLSRKAQLWHRTNTKLKAHGPESRHCKSGPRYRVDVGFSESSHRACALVCAKKVCCAVLLCIPAAPPSSLLCRLRFPSLIPAHQVSIAVGP